MKIHLTCSCGASALFEGDEIAHVGDKASPCAYLVELRANVWEKLHNECRLAKALNDEKRIGHDQPNTHGRSARQRELARMLRAFVEEHGAGGFAALFNEIADDLMRTAGDLDAGRYR